jgi:alpha-D-ribose 1-methylphosphonate 5-triphosphate synthase subunit PhnG
MTDINELFSRDPLKLTNENIDQIIAEMRKRRHLYIAGPAKAKAASTALTDAQKQASQLKIELKL